MLVLVRKRHRMQSEYSCNRLLWQFEAWIDRRFFLIVVANHDLLVRSTRDRVIGLFYLLDTQIAFESLGGSRGILTVGW